MTHKTKEMLGRVEIMKIGFDPYVSEETAAVFNDSMALKFYLLWRRSHIVGADFTSAVLRIAGRLKQQPETEEGILAAIRPEISGVSSFSLPDAKAFASEFLPYIKGEKTISWKMTDAASCSRPGGKA